MDQGGILDIARARPVERRGRSKLPRLVRDLGGLPPVLARTGSLELHLATTRAEIRRVQRLRYDVFYTHGDAVPDAYKAALGRDKCPFDRACDHLFVIDRAAAGATGKPRVVGTTRLLRGDVAASGDGFYSETEFVLDPLFARHPGTRFLELGRSCVDPAYRGRRIIDLRWQGVGLYAAHHGSDVLIGCSSLTGTRADLLAVPLSFAFHHARSPATWQVTPVPSRGARMDWLDPDSFDPRTALGTLPPLMKAYVRAGGTFSPEASVDYAFGTVDLFTLLPLASANPRYLAQFGAASTAAP